MKLLFNVDVAPKHKTYPFNTEDVCFLIQLVHDSVAKYICNNVAVSFLGESAFVGCSLCHGKAL